MTGTWQRNESDGGDDTLFDHIFRVQARSPSPNRSAVDIVQSSRFPVKWQEDTVGGLEPSSTIVSEDMCGRVHICFETGRDFVEQNHSIFVLPRFRPPPFCVFLTYLDM